MAAWAARGRAGAGAVRQWGLRAAGGGGPRPGEPPAQLPPRLYRQAEEDKSVYQKNEDGRPERLVRGQPYPDWRKPWQEQHGEFYSKLKLFMSDRNPSADVLTVMQQIPTLTPQKVAAWWREMKEYEEIENQIYMSERVELLGANLAAAHFLLFRNASIRFRGASNWLKGDPTIGEISIPDRFKEGYFVEAIDASTFHRNGLRYEGLANLANLNFLKWLSVKNNRHIDEWGMDRIAGLTCESLEFLDISGCKLKRGSIMAIARIFTLKVLVLDDPGEDKELEAAISELEEEKPHLIVKTVNPSEEKLI